MKNFDTQELGQKKDELEQLKYDFDMEFRSYLNFVEDEIAPEKLKIAKSTLDNAIEIVNTLSEDFGKFPRGLNTLPSDLRTETNLQYVINLFEMIDRDIEDAIDNCKIGIYIECNQNIKGKIQKGSYKPPYKDGYEIEILEFNSTYISAIIDETEYIPEEMFQLIRDALEHTDIDFNKVRIENGEEQDYFPLASNYFYLTYSEDNDEIYQFTSLSFNSIEELIKEIETKIPDDIFDLHSDISTAQGIVDMNGNTFWGSDVIDHLQSSPTRGLSHKIISEKNINNINNNKNKIEKDF